jgi:predicted amidohydrolase
MTRIKFTIVQLKYEGYKKTLKKALIILRKASKKSDFVIFSEYFLGWEDNYKNTIKIFRKEAKSLGVNLILGSMIEPCGKKRYNTCVLINKNGKIIGKYRKIHIYKKWEKINSGKQTKIFHISGIKIGILICLDIYFPEDVSKLRNSDMIVVPTMTDRREINEHICVIKTRASENVIPMILANAVGKHKNMTWGGKSVAVDPEGQIISKMDSKEGSKTFVIDMNKKDEKRKELFDIFGFR